ncbi:YaeQ family protein [Marinobacter sp. SS21]|uniref:YaeQ family protein n=1 Tax=Marinobacter sp. SS21 TaxID=2979460 RepID=UPI00232CC750|nr:YaeQ family protein [Marinobacter sp. SS21]MDC0661293.1 YaeQ family protein [Marinobacter sp. SS21]
MALKATIYKAQLNIADMDRSHYADHHLTLALHPSETEERMMLRLIAFALHATDTLEFTKGISTDNEPDLWQKDLSDDIELWIDLGLPEESRIRKACNRARQVVLYTYGGRAVPLWWDKIHGKLTRFDNLSVVNFPQEACAGLAELAHRSMQLQITIQDGEVGISDGERHVQIEPEPIPLR